MPWDGFDPRWYGDVLFSPMGNSIVYVTVPRHPDFEPDRMSGSVLSGEGSGGGTCDMTRRVGGWHPHRGTRGVEFPEGIEDQGYGLVTHFKMPGEVRVQLYEPRYVKGHTSS